MSDTNKIKYGIKNVYYAVATEATNGTLTFGTPVAMPGAVNLTLDPEGTDAAQFYADNIVYYLAPGSNNGYTGSIELAKIPDSFRKDVLGDIEDSNGLLVENAEAESAHFALLFEFAGDKMSTRHAIYNCTAARPSVASATKEEQVEPQTETVNLTAIPMKYLTAGTTPTEYQLVKAKANGTDSATQYNAWFATVQVPTITGA